MSTTLFPIIQPQAMEAEALPLCQEVKWDFAENRPIFRRGEPVVVEGREAVLTWAWLALHTPRFRHEIFSWAYGSELESLIGQPYTEALKQSEARRIVRDTLLVSPYVTDVSDILVDFGDGTLRIEGTISTIYGQVALDTGGQIQIASPPAPPAPKASPMCLICEDWDGTVIGAAAVEQGSIAGITEALDRFVAEHSAAETDEMGYSADPKKPLTNKAGYRFDGVWLWADSGAFECYLKPEVNYPKGVPAYHEELSAYPADVRVTVEGIQRRLAAYGTVRLRAAYEAQTNLNEGLGGGDYSCSIIESGKFGSASSSNGSYYVNIEVLRENAAGNPTVRMREPVLVVSRLTEGGNVGTVDRRILPISQRSVVELVLDRMDAGVQAYCTEGYKKPNWFNFMSFKSQIVLNNRVRATPGTNGFIKDCTVAAVDRAARAYLTSEDAEGQLPWRSYVNVTELSDIGVKYPGKTMQQAKDAILAEVQRRMAAGDDTPMTAADMQMAINDA